MAAAAALAGLLVMPSADHALAVGSSGVAYSVNVDVASAVIRQTDNSAPTVVSIKRQDPTAEHTNLDSLTWRVVFSEGVVNVDEEDFFVFGGSTEVSYTEAVGGSETTYDVIASGGSLSRFDGEVSLEFAANQEIWASAAPNADLDATLPTGANYETYTVDNTAPTLTIMPVDASTATFTATIAFSEDVAGFDDSGDATATGATVGTPTKKGADASAYTVVVMVSNPGASKTIMLRVAAGKATDLAGNYNAAKSQDIEYTAPAARPGAPTITSVTPGNAMLTVTWTAPADVGDSAIAGYDVRHKLTSAPDIEANWTEAANTGDDLSHTIGSLTNGTSYDVQVRASNAAGEGAWSDTTDGAPAAPTAPRVTSVTRKMPMTEHTNADNLTWTVEFSENVQNVTQEDFTTTGTTATRTVTGSNRTYDVSVSGGNLASLNAEVTLDFATSQNIEATASGNAGLDPAMPQGAANTFVVDNAAPTVTSILRQTPLEERVAADALVWRVEFSEGVKEVTVGDFDASGTSATAMVVEADGTSTTVYDVTVSGGDLAGLNGKVELGFASDQDIKDRARNDLIATLPTGANYETYTMDNPPPKVTSIKRQDPVTEHTKLDSLTWRVVFSQDVQNVDEEDFTISGGSADVSYTEAVGGSETTYDVTGSGGSLSRFDGEVSLEFAANQEIWASAAPNADLDATLPTGANYETYMVDNTAPTLTIMPVDASTATFTATIVFSEDVTGFGGDGDATATNATLGTLTKGGDERTYTVLVTVSDPSASVSIRLKVAAGKAADLAGNYNAATSRDIEYMAPATTPGAPTISSVTPDSSTLTVTWTAPDSTGGSEVTGYDVRHKLTSAQDIAANWTVVANTGNDLSHTIGSLTNGTSYDVQVRAVNIAGDGAWSDTTDGAPRTTPAAPTISSVTPGNVTLTVTWTIPGNGGSAVTGYDVRHKLTSAQDIAANWTVVANTGDDLSHTIGSLANGTSYDVQVRAVNVAGDGAWSATTDGAPRTTPAAPTISSVTPGNVTLTVTWTIPGNGGSTITGYDVRHKLSSAQDIAANWAEAANTGDDLSHTIGSLANGTSYDVQVRAVNVAGDGAWSATTDGTPRTTPAAPTITSVTPGNVTLTVTWTAPDSTGGSAITGYDVRHKLTSAQDIDANWTEAANTGDDLSHTIGSLTNGTSYDVQVRAVNVAGDGAWSDTTDGTPRTTPAAPTISSVTAGNASLTVTWVAPANTGGSAITGYDVRHKLTSAQDIPENWTEAANTGNDLSHAITGLTNRTSYDVQVRAVNVAGDGAWSDTSAGTPVAVPSAPAAPTVTAGNVTLTVTWAAPANTGGSAITGYDVRHKLSSAQDIDANWTEVANTGDDLSHTIGSLTNGTSYDVQVRAVNIAGDGAWSATTDGTPRTTPVAPTISSVTAGNATLTVTWVAPDSNGGSVVTGYDVRHKLTSAQDIDANWTVVANTGNDLSHTIAGLTNRTSYDVQVRAVNVAGDGAWSATSAGTPVETPGAPAAPTVTAGVGELTVTWTAPADGVGSAITGYDVRHKLSSASDIAANWTEAANIGNDLSHTIISLTNDTQYDVQVRAVNAEGDGAWSATTTGRPRTTPAAPAAPTLRPGNGQLTVDWTAPADGGATIIAYDMRHKLTSAPDADASWIEVDDVWRIGPLTAAITGLANGVQYDVQVRAMNSAGDGAWSATSTGAPAATGSTPAPGAPGPPAVTTGNRTLTVRWSAPVDEGSAPITAYDLRHRPSGGGWTIVDSAWTSGALRHTITDLSNGAQYEVQVRAVSAAGAGGWSTTTAGIPTAPPLPPPPPEVEDSGASSAPPLPQNRAPAFAEGIYATRSVAENAVGGANVGGPVVATDADGDRLTYALRAALNYVLTAADVDFFAIDQATGQITVRTGTTLDYETKATYVVVVSVRDGKGDFGEADNATDDSITVAIEVTNVELPGVASAYDADFNEILDRDEVLKAIDDYFRDGMNKEEMLETVGLYVPG